MPSKRSQKVAPTRPFWLRFLTFWVRLVRFFIWPPGLYITLTVLAGLSIWHWWTDIMDIFGWGAAFIALAIMGIIILIWRRKIGWLFRKWHYWLGIAAFVALVWGALAFFDRGGDIGLAIIGSQSFVGALRLVGIFVVGFVLVAPRTTFSLLGRLFSRMAERRGEAPSPTVPSRSGRPAREPRSPVDVGEAQAGAPALPPRRGFLGLGARRSGSIVGQAPSAPTKPPMTVIEPKPPSQPADLKQVAQEVWKKYGESPSLVVADGWKLPPIDILEKSPEIVFSQADNNRRARLIEEALESYGVEAKVVQINTGPTVTQFGIEPGWDRRVKEVREKDREGRVKMRQEEVSRTRVKVERITSLANDLALALAASTIRIEAPIPGQSVVGIEVPNTQSTTVTLRGVIETSAFQKTQSKTKLAIALGKGAGGEAVSADLTRMPHLLIAGATGSGKTVCLNTIVCGLMMNNTPYDLRFVMIDPKRVELTEYNGIPHLAAPVIVDAEKAVETLRWLNVEMDRRYQKLQGAGARSIDGYNKNRTGDQKMVYLVLVIDELADLMMLGGDEVERILCRLAQLARAVGIHLVVATQRPSVDVITGLIKANFPTRISFAVTSQVDSRTILDGAGAEKLLGKGDMLFMPTEAAKPKRLQGCFVSDGEIERLVYFWSNQRRGEMPSLRIDDVSPAAAKSARSFAGPEDPLIEEARIIAAEHPHFSASYLQRKLRIGFNRAARIVEQLEFEGYGVGKKGRDASDDPPNDEGEEEGEGEE